MNENDTQDTNLTIEQQGQEEPEQDNPPMTRRGLVQALKQGVKNGLLSKNQATQIKLENGITKSGFTKKRPDRDKAKRKRKLQKNARKVTHSKGFKGQKNDKGKQITKQ